MYGTFHAYLITLLILTALLQSGINAFRNVEIESVMYAVMSSPCETACVVVTVAKCGNVANVEYFHAVIV